MRRYRVRFTPEAEEDLLRLYDFLLDKDLGAAERALEAIKEATRLLQFSPFSCRKVRRNNPFLRELVIPFGSTGYVALYEIDGRSTVTVLAVRHQREEDYH
ncbi:MAG: type II toxin-antitoxin system RelE/ParE family toxin [Terriglobales bacterium]